MHTLVSGVDEFSGYSYGYCEQCNSPDDYGVGGCFTYQDTDEEVLVWFEEHVAEAEGLTAVVEIPGFEGTLAQLDALRAGV